MNMPKNAQQEFMRPPCASRPFCEIGIMQIVRIPEESIFRVPLTAVGQNKHQGWDTILGITEFIFMPLHKDLHLYGIYGACGCQREVNALEMRQKSEIQ